MRTAAWVSAALRSCECKGPRKLQTFHSQKVVKGAWAISLFLVDVL